MRPLRRCKLGERKVDDAMSPVVGSITFGPVAEEEWSLGSTKPHLCPVCEGRGEVRSGFYLPQHDHTLWSESSQAHPMERCRSCRGRGVVWKP